MDPLRKLRPGKRVQVLPLRLRAWARSQALPQKPLLYHQLNPSRASNSRSSTRTGSHSRPCGIQTLKREVTTVKPLRGVRINPEERQWHATVVHGRDVLEPCRHPRTHDVPVAFIQFRAHSPSPVQLAAHFSPHASASLGIPVSDVVSPPRSGPSRVPRCPFAQKKKVAGEL